MIHYEKIYNIYTYMNENKLNFTTDDQRFGLLKIFNRERQKFQNPESTIIPFYEFDIIKFYEQKYSEIFIL